MPKYVLLDLNGRGLDKAEEIFRGRRFEAKCEGTTTYKGSRSPAYIFDLNRDIDSKTSALLSEEYRIIKPKELNQIHL